METEKLKDLQNIQIQIMDEVHDICVKNKIKYYIIGGTALGAVRHKGFIPWDIDIDIAMYREDYLKFREICKTELPEKLEYKDYLLEKNFFPPHALVVMKNTKLIQKDDYLNKKIKRYGIFLDIFPLDQAPNEIYLQKKQASKIKKIRNLKVRKLAIKYRENSMIKRFIKDCISLFYFYLSIDKLNRKEQEIMQMYNTTKQSKYWCSMASHYSYEKQCMNKEIYGEPTLVEFAGREYYGPEKMDEYLKRIYGDYMKLPSVESQQSQIDYFIDAEW